MEPSGVPNTIHLQCLRRRLSILMCLPTRRAFAYTDSVAYLAHDTDNFVCLIGPPSTVHNNNPDASGHLVSMPPIGHRDLPPSACGLWRLKNLTFIRGLMVLKTRYFG